MLGGRPRWGAFGGEMKKTLVVVICICFVFISCTKKEQTKIEQNSEVEKDETIIFNNDISTLKIQTNTENQNEEITEVITSSADYNHHTDDPNYWTNEKQKEVYNVLFQKQDLTEVLNFHTFIESLAKYHHNEPLYEYNPIFLCYEQYPENLQFFLENKKELFLFGNMNWGDYSESPFLYVIKNKSLEDVKFYFDNEIPVLESKDELLYGSRNAGGPRFGIGGNILLYAENEEIRNYLISKGIPTEIKAVDYFYYYLKDDSVNIYENPGLNNSIVATITKEDSFTPISVLTYRIDNQKWMKIKFNEKEGWIPESSFDYDTGI